MSQDVFEYELDETMALYGSVPFMTAHNAERSVGVFFHNAAEMWIVVERARADSLLSDTLSRLWKASGGASSSNTHTHWMVESGVIDLFLMPGPTATDVLRQYYDFTGLPALPPLFALGYHQCRWN